MHTCVVVAFLFLVSGTAATSGNGPQNLESVASQPSRSSRLGAAFYHASIAGFVALAFNFLLRIGGLAPFPPEAGIEAFIKVIPASIQEPAVQQLGDFAAQLGLLVASAIAIVVYGLLGVAFQRVLARVRAPKKLSQLELFLSFALVPWILFGAILLPLFGASVFGLSSPASGAGSSSMLFPVSLLVVQLVYSFVMFHEFKGNGLLLLHPGGTTPVDGVHSTTSPIIYPSKNRAFTRRAFVEKGALGVAVLALSVTSLGTLISTSLSESSTSPPAVAGSGSAINLQDAPRIFSDPRLAPLVDAEVTSNNSFYRVAIDLFDPSVDGSTWTLELDGLLSSGQAKTYTLDDLKNNFPPVNEYNTFECVSNEINGNLIGNAKWTGVRISDLLSDAGGAASGARYVVFYSVDGYSVAIPLATAMMKESILAYSMNDQVLPQKHGYPLRAVIPGLYGMMSAKWINKVQVVDSSYLGYWQSRGWSDVGTVQTVAFISIPSDNSSVSLSKSGGSVLLGGVAYAGDRGITKVEVSTDGGRTWQGVQLKPAIGSNTWTLWAFEWKPASGGTYPVYARATDGTGALQTSVAADTFPNGATGYAMIAVQVTE